MDRYIPPSERNIKLPSKSKKKFKCNILNALNNEIKANIAYNNHLNNTLKSFGSTGKPSQKAHLNKSQISHSTLTSTPSIAIPHLTLTSAPSDAISHSTLASKPSIAIPHSTLISTPSNAISPSTLASTPTIAIPHSTLTSTPSNAISHSSIASTPSIAIPHSTLTSTPSNAISQSSGDAYHSATTPYKSKDTQYIFGKKLDANNNGSKLLPQNRKPSQKAHLNKSQKAHPKEFDETLGGDKSQSQIYPSKISKISPANLKYKQNKALSADEIQHTHPKGDPLGGDTLSYDPTVKFNGKKHINKIKSQKIENKSQKIDDAIMRALTHISLGILLSMLLSHIYSYAKASYAKFPASKSFPSSNKLSLGIILTILDIG